MGTERAEWTRWKRWRTTAADGVHMWAFCDTHWCVGIVICLDVWAFCDMPWCVGILRHASMCGHSVTHLVPEVNHILQVQQFLHWSLQDCQQTQTVHNYKIMLINTTNIVCRLILVPETSALGCFIFINYFYILSLCARLISSMQRWKYDIYTCILIHDIYIHVYVCANMLAHIYISISKLSVFMQQLLSDQVLQTDGHFSHFTYLCLFQYKAPFPHSVPSSTFRTQQHSIYFHNGIIPAVNL